MGFNDREKKREENSVVRAIAGIDTPRQKKATNNTGRVQKAYFIDRDLFKALQKKAMSEEINLTESINIALRKGLEEYL